MNEKYQLEGETSIIKLQFQNILPNFMDIVKEGFKDDIGVYNRSALNQPLQVREKDNYMKNTIVGASKAREPKNKGTGNSHDNAVVKFRSSALSMEIKDFNIAIVRHRYKNKGSKRRKISEAYRDLESAVQILNEEGLTNMFKLKLYDKHWHTVEYIQ